MNMKILGLLIVMTSPVMADDAAKAFATGFANALNRSMGGREYQAPSYNQPQVNVYVEPVVTPHYDAVSTGGTMGGYFFFNNGECQRFLKRNVGYDDCVRVQ